ncbi:hypothetical protein JXR93_05320 [bacterium]|nr:hypothetical protein [bacterium]
MRPIIIILTILLSFNCFSDDKKNAQIEKKQKKLVVTIVSDSKLKFNSKSKIKFTLYGYNSRMADVSATELFKYTKKIDKIPMRFELPFEENLSEKIEYKSSSKADFKYYLTFTIDVNGDGFVDSKDYRQNYDKSDQIFVSNINELNGKIYIQKMDKDSGSEKF